MFWIDSGVFKFQFRGSPSILLGLLLRQAGCLHYFPCINSLTEMFNGVEMHPIDFIEFMKIESVIILWFNLIKLINGGIYAL
jgi:hypothetical protein